jgi:hypothetical protein
MTRAATSTDTRDFSRPSIRPSYVRCSPLRDTFSDSEDSESADGAEGRMQVSVCESGQDCSLWVFRWRTVRVHISSNPLEVHSIRIMHVTLVMLRLFCY